MALLSIKDLSLGYDGAAIVEGLNFDVLAGDYICIVGENGSGKTTLMRTLLGLIEPVRGSIEAGEGLRKNEIGYLPQQTLVQRDFPASVREIVLSGFQGRLGRRPFYSKEEKKEAENKMERMGVAGFARKSYRELSGGQQQRVLLARALCAAQRIILLDEPVSGLDPKAANEMYELVDKLNREGVAVIMISHDVSAALKYAKRILSIGESIFFGTKEEYLRSDAGRVFASFAENGTAQKADRTASSETERGVYGASGPEMLREEGTEGGAK